ncbi:MAG: hypothetical protein R2770_17735 [Acidimicrobiales bacterium]
MAGNFGAPNGDGGVNPNGHYDGGGSGGTDPVPYPDVGGDGGGDTKEVDLEFDSGSSSSAGDDAGVNKGVGTQTNAGPSEFLTYAFDVKYEGKDPALSMATPHSSEEPEKKGEDGEGSDPQQAEEQESSSIFKMDPYGGPGHDPVGPDGTGSGLNFDDDRLHDLLDDHTIEDFDDDVDMFD